MRSYSSTKKPLLVKDSLQIAKYPELWWRRQADSSASSKPSVKYDDWMMERLKKNKKEPFEYLKILLEENALG